ncbi:MAG: glycosyl hydrolase, partial [Actinomycetota bacterium]
AIPNGSNDTPASLQTLFGAKTDTTPTLGTDYLPAGSGWNGMDGAKGSLSYLADWASGGDQLVLGVPIIPKSLGSAVGTLQAGAQGSYNQYFTQLAKTLVSEHLGNAWLRLGWEFDNNAYAWQAKTPAAEGYYATYFRNIVTTMRAVAGANFKYVWNPDAFAFAGAGDPVVPGYNVALAWPGSSYVDFIGLDSYDQGPSSAYTATTTWAWIAPQLSAAASFASSHAEPLAFPEWGVAAPELGMYGNGDDPAYINNMYAFMTTASNHVAWESYFNISELGWNSQITGGAFPKSLAAFKTDFGNG